MNMTEVQLATTTEQIQACYRAMQQLRPHHTEKAAFVSQVQRQIKEGYQLAYTEADQEVKALAGFRFLECLAWGKVLYIDDLITDSETRRSGQKRKLRSSPFRQWSTASRRPQAVLKPRF